MQDQSNETRTCSRCSIEKPYAHFPHRPNGTVNGSRCNECQAELRRLERAARPPRPVRFRDRDRTEKACGECGQGKSVAEFYWNQRKWSAECRECTTRKLRIKYVPHPRSRTPGRRVTPTKERKAERFWAKVDKTAGADGCWLWLGYLTSKGYGLTGSGLAHRFAFHALVRPIRAGYEIDHLCFNPACVNPAHLEEVAPAENKRRARMHHLQAGNS